MIRFLLLVLLLACVADADDPCYDGYPAAAVGTKCLHPNQRIERDGNTFVCRCPR